MTFLDKLLQYLQVATEFASALPGQIGAESAIAAKLVAIASAASAAHKALTGKPIDMAALHDLPPIP